MTAVSEQSQGVETHVSRTFFILLHFFRIEYLFGIFLFPAVCSPYVLLVYKFLSKGFF